MSDLRPTVLRALAADDLTASEIARRTDVPAKQIRMAVAMACGAGWVRQLHQHPTDHECVYRLTDRGRERLANGEGE